MNFENVTALVIKLFGVYQIYLAVDDMIYCLAKQATDPLFKLYHFYALMIAARIFLGLIIISVAVPLGKRLVDSLKKTSEEEEGRNS